MEMRDEIGAKIRTKIRDGADEPRRHDSADKHVSGAAVYADDVREPRDLLHCYIALSAKARARLTKVDLAAVRRHSGAQRHRSGGA
jgi:xanthine dehydrogenase large subunit